MKIPIAILWGIVQLKTSLFWLYLWQLKNYHTGRFIDHFRTKKGKSIFINPLYLLKILFLFIPFLGLALIAFEGIYNILKGKFIKPVFTKKIIFLFFFTISLFAILFLKFKDSYFDLLLINILTPFVISFIVLLFQPLTVLLRSLILLKAKNKRKKLKNLKVIGITGSYGKSGTKEFLYEILASKYKNVKKTKNNENSEMGISKFILNTLSEKDEFFVCEMGAYNKGGIKLLCNIADPQIGILTGINNQHLSTFGSQENIVKTKFELVEYVKDFSIVNWDNFLIKKYAPKKTFKYSYLEKQDIYAENIKVFKEHIEFDACLKTKERQTFKVNVLGKQNVSNLLGAIFVAYKLGMNLKEIAKGVGNIKQGHTGMTLENNVIDATYSGNANGVIAHLNFLKLWKGKRVIVMPCLIELQKESKRIHREIGEKIYEVCDLAIITTPDCLEELKEKGKEKIIYEKNPDKILEILKKYNHKEDIILLESRVPSKIIKK